MCGEALPRRKQPEKDWALPLVWPLAHEHRAEPEPGAEPIVLSNTTGEAEPRLISGGEAVEKYPRRSRREQI
jgi:hypothetical protein